MAPADRMRLRYNRRLAVPEVSIDRGAYASLGFGSAVAAQQTAWFIDPVGGDDANTGLTADAPLRTHEELRQRIGSQLINQTVTINLMDDFDRDNPIICDFRIGADGGLRYVGTKTLTTLVSGTFTDVTPLSRGGNAATIVEDTALAGDWGALGLVNTQGSDMRRIRLTSGANVGAVALACADLGTKTARTTPFGDLQTSLGGSDPNFRVLNGPPSASDPNYGAPAIGDDYVVESGFVVIDVFLIAPTLAGNFDGFPGDVQVLVNDIEMSTTFGLSLVIDAVRNRTAAPGVSFSGVGLGNCGMFSGVAGADFCRLGGSVIDLRGGIMEIAASVVLGDINQRPGSEGLYYVDALSQGGNIDVEGKFVFSNGAVFDDDGDAVVVLPGGVVVTDGFFGLDPQSALYGDGNTGFGMEIKAGGQLVYDPIGATPAASNITITGTAGDFEIAGGGATLWTAPTPDLTDTGKLAGVSANT